MSDAKNSPLPLMEISSHLPDFENHLPDFANHRHDYGMLGSGLRHIGIGDANGRVIATVWNHHDSQMADENAALIVRAVNALADLLAALEEIAGTFDAESYPRIGSIERTAGDKARAALKAAES